MFEAPLLGRIIQCPHCRRHLRPGLQFVMADRKLAPNLTVQCSCGHFVVERADRTGKQVTCAVCRKRLAMPEPVADFAEDCVVRVPRKALENQLRRVRPQKKRVSDEITRLTSAARSGRISLRPGEHICANPECGALLGPGANVCPKCGTNRLTGERYEGPGPEKDPRGKWREV
jgi:ribosomal protein L40E